MPLLVRGMSCEPILRASETAKAGILTALSGRAGLSGRNTSLVAAAACSLCLGLAACGSSERGKIADRAEPAISQAQGRKVAETMADDALSLRTDSQSAAAAQAAVDRQFDDKDRTPDQAMSRECAEMRQSITALQHPFSEIRTDEQEEQLSENLERLQAKVAADCT